MSFTNFGFQRILKSEKQQKVHEIFKRVAGNYDLMNDFMSVGVHRLWKKRLVDQVASGLNAPSPYKFNLLDICGGTGDIAYGLAEKMQFKEHQIRCIDINADMLQVGRDKLQSQSITFEEGNAQELNMVEDHSQDSVTVAFGIRNCTEPFKVLEEAYRVLKPGGKFYCLEFSHVTNPLLKPLYDVHSFVVIPALGAMVANDRDSYQYLVESIRKFPKQREFSTMIKQAGFKTFGLGYENLSMGIAAIHTGHKIK